MNLLGESLRAQVIISIRQDWTYVVHDAAEVESPEDAARLAGIVAMAAVEVAHKRRVRLPSLEAALDLR